MLNIIIPGQFTALTINKEDVLARELQGHCIEFASDVLPSARTLKMELRKKWDRR